MPKVNWFGAEIGKVSRPNDGKVYMPVLSFTLKLKEIPSIVLIDWKFLPEISRFISEFHLSMTLHTVVTCLQCLFIILDLSTSCFYAK